jgi:hypothetical protein
MGLVVYIKSAKSADVPYPPVAATLYVFNRSDQHCRRQLRQDPGRISAKGPPGSMLCYGMLQSML